MLSHRKGVLLDGIGSELVRASTGGVRKTLSKWLSDLSAAITLGDVASTFTSGDATPSVLDNSKFITAGTTAITNFDDGVEGQIITVYRGGSDIVITDNANFTPIIAGNLTLSATRPSASFRLASGVWVQVEEAGAASTAMLPVVQGSINQAMEALDQGAFTVTGSTTARNLATRFGNVVNVRDYGAVADGATNDRAAFVAAAAAAIAQGRALYVPAGGTYFYSGAGLTGADLRVIGDGLAQTVILLDTGSYLIDDDAVWGSIHVEGIRTVNGAGVIRNRYTGSMVNMSFTVRDCLFYQYTNACISNNSSDNPHWHIENNIFWGADSTSTVGLALKGLTDSNYIAHNSFRLNKVDIKLGDGGNNAYLHANDFVRYATGTGRVNIHIVPDTDGVNAGSGFVITSSNKFGNENLDATDFRIVYADELSGTHWGDRLPDMVTNSTGVIRGHRIGGTFYGTSGTPQQPLIKSMTKNTFGCHWGDITIGGTPPTYVVEWSTAPDALTNEVYWNIIGPISCDGADDLTGFALASSYNNVKIIDPVGAVATSARSAFVRASDLGSGVQTFLGTPSAANFASAVPYIVHGAWTPVLTFATPGDLACTYSVQTGFYTQVGVPGAGFVTASFNLTTSAFTHTTASGDLQVTGLPVAQATASGILPFGSGRFTGVTKANYTQFCPTIASAAQVITFTASGSAQSNATITAADMPTGGAVNLAFQITYRI